MFSFLDLAVSIFFAILKGKRTETTVLLLGLREQRASCYRKLFRKDKGSTHSPRAVDFIKPATIPMTQTVIGVRSDISVSKSDRTELDGHWLSKDYPFVAKNGRMHPSSQRTNISEAHPHCH